MHDITNMEQFSLDAHWLAHSPNGLQQLVGGTITGVVFDEGDPAKHEFPCAGITVEINGSKRVCWFASDAEFNAPGFVHIYRAISYRN